MESGYSRGTPSVFSSSFSVAKGGDFDRHRGPGETERVPPKVDALVRIPRQPCQGHVHEPQANAEEREWEVSGPSNAMTSVISRARASAEAERAACYRTGGLLVGCFAPAPFRVTKGGEATHQCPPRVPSSRFSAGRVWRDRVVRLAGLRSNPDRAILEKTVWGRVP